MFAAAGLVVLLYDHILTLPDEIALIWHSPSSFAKYAFIANRYLVPFALSVIAFEMCGLSGFIFTDGVSVLFVASINFLSQTSNPRCRHLRGRLDFLMHHDIYPLRSITQLPFPSNYSRNVGGYLSWFSEYTSLVASRDIVGPQRCT